MAEYLAAREPGALAQRYELEVEDLVAQVGKIQHLMAKVMKEGEHFGVIPGTGTKPTLLKPGAEKLCLLFRLAPDPHSVETYDGKHLTVKSKCDLYHIPTGQKWGAGEGSCSTKESKYAYRQGKRVCPSCGADAILRSKFPPKKNPHGEPGWYCYTKREGCGAEFAATDPTIVNQTTGRIPNEDLADQYNCVTPETRLLTHDLRWVPAGKIATGDILVGVQEQMESHYSRHLATGEATVYGTREELVYELSCEDGRTVRCNGGHQWLVREKGLKGTEWVSTEEIHREWSARRGRPRHWAIMSFCTPWDEDPSKDAGYLAGLLDADGSLGINQVVVMFAQQENGVLKKMESELNARGFAVGKSKCKTADELERCKSKHQVYGLRILGGLAEQMRALGSLRPPRLLERWLTRIDLSTRRLEGRGSGAGKPARITAVTTVGEQDIVLLGSSCGTYIAEGLVAHNTVVKMSNKRALVAAVLNVTAASDIFTQDVEDAAPMPPAAHAGEVIEGEVVPSEAAPPVDREAKVRSELLDAIRDYNERLKLTDAQAKLQWARAIGPNVKDEDAPTKKLMALAAELAGKVARPDVPF